MVIRSKCGVFRELCDWMHAFIKELLRPSMTMSLQHNDTCFCRTLYENRLKALVGTPRLIHLTFASHLNSLSARLLWNYYEAKVLLYYAKNASGRAGTRKAISLHYSTPALLLNVYMHLCFLPTLLVLAQKFDPTSKFAGGQQMWGSLFLSVPAMS